MLPYYLIRDVDVTSAVIDALNDVWDNKLGMLDFEEVDAEAVKPHLLVYLCMLLLHAFDVNICYMYLNSLHCKRKDEKFIPNAGKEADATKEYARVPDCNCSIVCIFCVSHVFFVYFTINKVLGGVNKLLKMIGMAERLIPKLHEKDDEKTRRRLQSAANDMQLDIW